MLEAKMPKLCHVELAAIELTSGSWEGIFEGLRIKKLQSLELPRQTDQLRHKDGEVYPKTQPEMAWRDYLIYVEDFRRDIERYVVNGGRHPGLPAGAPDRDARKYLDECYQIDHQSREQQKIDRYKRAWRIPKDAQIGVDEYSIMSMTR